MSSDHDADPVLPSRRPSLPLLFSGVAAVAIALWAVFEGPSLIGTGTLLAILAIGATAVAGLLLIVRPSSTTESTPSATDDDNADIG